MESKKIMMHFLICYVFAENLSDDILGQIVTIQATDQGLKNIYMDGKKRFSLIKPTDIKNKVIEIKFIREHKNHYVIEVNGRKLCYAGEGAEIEVCKKEEKNAKNMLWKVLPMEQKNTYRIYSEMVKLSADKKKRRFCMTPRNDKIVTEECKKSDKSQIFKIKKSQDTYSDDDECEDVESSSSEEVRKKVGPKKKQTLTDKALAALNDPNYDLSEYDISVPEEYEIIDCSNETEKTQKNNVAQEQPKNTFEQPKNTYQQPIQNYAQSSPSIYPNQYSMGFNSYFGQPLQYTYQPPPQQYYPNQPFQYNYSPQQQPVFSTPNSQPITVSANQPSICHVASEQIPSSNITTTSATSTTSMPTPQQKQTSENTQKIKSTTPFEMPNTEYCNDLPYEKIVISDEIDPIEPTSSSSISRNKSMYNRNEVLNTNQVLYKNRYTTIIPASQSETKNNIYTVVLLNSSMQPQSIPVPTSEVKTSSDMICTPTDSLPKSIPITTSVASQNIVDTSTLTDDKATNLPATQSQIIADTSTINQPLTNVTNVINNAQSTPIVPNTEPSAPINIASTTASYISQNNAQISEPNNLQDINSSHICKQVSANEIQDYNIPPENNEQTNANVTQEDSFTDEANVILGNSDKTLIDCVSNAPSACDSLGVGEPPQEADQTNKNEVKKETTSMNEDNLMSLLNEYIKEQTSQNIKTPDADTNESVQNNNNDNILYETPEKVGGMQIEYVGPTKTKNDYCETRDSFDNDENIDKNSVYIGQAKTTNGMISIFKDPKGVFYLRGDLPECPKNNYKIVCEK